MVGGFFISICLEYIGYDHTMRRFLQTLILVCTVLLWTSAHAEKKIFLVSLENPPQTYTKNGQVWGFNTDIAREALRRAGYAMEIQLVPWSRALAMVRMGQADGIIDAAFTTERSAYLLYPHTPVYEERFHAFQRADTDISFDQNFSGAEKTARWHGPRLLLRSAPPLHCSSLLCLQRWRRRWVLNATSASCSTTGWTSSSSRTVPLWTTARKMGVADKIKPALSSRDGKPLLMSISTTYLAFSRKNISQEFVDKIDHILKQMQDDGFMKRTREAYKK